jgi:hypothetical protein
MDLFTYAALHRPSDPDTSREGAEHAAAKLSELQQRVLSVATQEPYTAAELAGRCVIRYGGLAETFRKRVGELVGRGLVVDGRRECTVTGAMARTFRRAT